MEDIPAILKVNVDGQEKIFDTVLAVVPEVGGEISASYSDLNGRYTVTSVGHELLVDEEGQCYMRLVVKTAPFESTAAYAVRDGRLMGPG